MMWKYFGLGHITLLVGLTLGYFYAGISGFVAVALLAMLEVSVSFDNAVVNAKVLETMTEKWRKRFITFGIPIAVFGMRFLFPIAIVAIAASMSMLEAFKLALYDPMQYHHALEANKVSIFSFGGAFLLMVFFSFLFDPDKEHSWISFLEDSAIVKYFKKFDFSGALFAIFLLAGLYLYDPVLTYDQILVPFALGVFLFNVIAWIDDHLSTDGVRHGAIGFLYLEVLDASFSFDGVIGAFALSTDIFIIMIGLGIGAMYVREMTIYLVVKKTLAEFKYLEHGAMFAIGALATIMFVKIFTEINEIIVGTVGIGFIIIAVLHSLWEKKNV